MNYIRHLPALVTIFLLTFVFLDIHILHAADETRGLTAHYYDGSDFTQQKGVRIDRTINFNWLWRAPLKGMGTDTFSVKWEGYITPRQTAHYTFYTKSDDGVKVTINDQTVIENWTDHAVKENKGTIELVANTSYPITVLYYENRGMSVMRLMWSSDSISKQIVPSSVLSIEENSTEAPLPIPTPTNSPTPQPTMIPTPSVTPVPSSTPPNPSGSISGGGLGVGSGFGPEVGINMTKFNQLKANAAQGMYERPCTQAEHDRTKWHTLVNDSAKCHYDHEHGDDPYFVEDIFGEPGAWFGTNGQSISYPWQTFTLPVTTRTNEALAQYGSTGEKENDLKHPGYYWIVRRDQTCAAGEWCITDSRLQVHFMTSHFSEVPVRFHSFSFEGRLCKDINDKSTCGMYRTGGWTDHGQLFVPSIQSECWTALNKNPIGGALVRLASDSQYYPLNSQGLVDEMRCHKTVTDSIVKSFPNGYQSAVAEWWTHGAYDFRYVVKVFDPISNVDPESPDRHTNHNQFYCSQEDTSCRWNNSVMSAGQGYTTQIWRDYGYVSVDSDSDGRTDINLGKLYLNRFGGINNLCTKASLDCIPLEISNVLLNNNPAPGEARYSNMQCESCQKTEHDITPINRPSWINWFYNY